MGGGLSADPHLAVRLNAFVRWEQALPVVRTIAEIFRDQDVLRENRKRARMKHLFTQFGWTPDRFLEELNARLGYRLDPAVEESAPVDVYRDHVGIHKQKHDGLFYVGASVLRGRTTPEQMRAAADLADRFGSGELRTTNMQNLLIVNVPRANVDVLARELDRAGLPVAASPFWRGAIACTGTEFCKLAITETKGLHPLAGRRARRTRPCLRSAAQDSRHRLPEFLRPALDFRYWPRGQENQSRRARASMPTIFASAAPSANISASPGPSATAAPPAKSRTPSPASCVAYVANRFDDENLRSYFSRFSDHDLRAQLAGYEAPFAERDAAEGAVPEVVGD